MQIESDAIFLNCTDWSAAYAPQSEVCEYLQKVATKYELQKNAKFQCTVQSMAWEEESSTWKLGILDKANNNAEIEIACSYVYVFVRVKNYSFILWIYLNQLIKLFFPF